MAECGGLWGVECRVGVTKVDLETWDRFRDLDKQGSLGSSWSETSPRSAAFKTPVLTATSPCSPAHSQQIQPSKFMPVLTPAHPKNGCTTWATSSASSGSGDTAFELWCVFCLWEGAAKATRGSICSCPSEPLLCSPSLSGNVGKRRMGLMGNWGCDPASYQAGLITLFSVANQLKINTDPPSSAYCCNTTPSPAFYVSYPPPLTPANLSSTR